MRFLPRGAVSRHRQVGWRGTEPVRAFGWRGYDRPRSYCGGFLGGEPPRASVFWGSTVPPRPYSLPLDGRAVTGKRAEFAPLRYVRLPFREIAASRNAHARNNKAERVYVMFNRINRRIRLYSLSFRGNGVTVGISRKGNVSNGDRRQFL